MWHRSNRWVWVIAAVRTGVTAWTDDSVSLFTDEACYTVNVLSKFAAPMYVRAMYTNQSTRLESYRVAIDGQEILDAEFPTALDQLLPVTSGVSASEARWGQETDNWQRQATPVDSRPGRRLLAAAPENSCTTLAAMGERTTELYNGASELMTGEGKGDADTAAMEALLGKLKDGLEINNRLSQELCELQKNNTRTTASLDEIQRNAAILTEKLKKGEAVVHQLREAAIVAFDKFKVDLDLLAARGSAFERYFSAVVQAQYYEVDLLRRRRLAKVYAARRTLLLDLSRRSQASRMGQLRLLAQLSQRLADPTCNQWLRLPDPIVERWQIVSVHPGYATQAHTAPPPDFSDPAYVQAAPQVRTPDRLLDFLTPYLAGVPNGTVFYLNEMALCETTIVATLSDVFYQAGIEADLLDYIVISTNNTRCFKGRIPPMHFPTVQDPEAGPPPDPPLPPPTTYTTIHNSVPTTWQQVFDGVLLVTVDEAMSVNRSMARLFNVLSVLPDEIDYGVYDLESREEVDQLIDERWGLLRQVDALPFEAGNTLLRGTGRESQALMADSPAFPWRDRLHAWATEAPGAGGWTELAAEEGYVPDGPALWFEGTLADLNDSSKPLQLMYDSYFSPLTHGRRLVKELHLPRPAVPPYVRWLLDHSTGRLRAACYGPLVWMAALSHRDQLTFDYWRPVGTGNETVRAVTGTILNATTARPVAPGGSVVIGYAPPDWTLIPGESSAVRDYFRGHFYDGWIGTNGALRAHRVFLSGRPLRPIDGHVNGGAAVYCGTANVRLLSSAAFRDQQGLATVWAPWSDEGNRAEARWPWDLVAHETRALVRGYNWAFDGSLYNLYQNFSDLGIVLLDEQDDWKTAILEANDKISDTTHDINAGLDQQLARLGNLTDDFRAFFEQQMAELHETRIALDKAHAAKKAATFCSVWTPNDCAGAGSVFLMWVVNLLPWALFVGTASYIVRQRKNR